MAVINESYFQKFYDLSTEGALFFDPEGNYFGANATACKALEYTLEEILQLNVRDLIPKYVPSDLIKTLFEKFFLEVSPVDGEIELTTKRGKIIKVFFKAHPYVVENISALFFREASHSEINFKNDVNSIYFLQKNTVSEAINLIAHEINQPLCALSNYLNVILIKLRKLENQTELQSIVEKAIRQSERAGHILHSTKEYNRTSALNKVKIKPQKIIKNVLDYLEPDINKNSVNLLTHINDTLPEIFVDQTQVEQALLNIMINAIEAMQNKTRKRIAITLTSEPPEYVNFQFRDFGDGIPDAIQQKLFTPYLTSKPHGTGLGLWIAKNFIENNGGKIVHARETAPPSTIFSIYLPVETS